jgi:uncharacterized NAD(P)/FAD-binding protein YdhS
LYVKGHATHVIVCGGGASAVLFVHALSKRKQTPLDVTIVEQRERAGHGLAYSTPCESHLLNVPVDRMSIDGEEPRHFLRWLNV